MNTTGEMEAALASELGELRHRSDLPPALRHFLELAKDRSFEVRLLDSRKRKLNRRAKLQKRAPDIAAVTISLAPVATRTESQASDNSQARPEHSTPSQGSSPDVPTLQAPPNAPDIDLRLSLLRALDDAERRPGHSFVALKWFRDAVLPGVRPEFHDPALRHRVLSEAIAKRLLLVYKVPNPKNPSFPVTAVKINRENPTGQP